MEPETFARDRCRHVPPYPYPRQEAPQREYPPARGLRSLGPAGPRPAPSVAGGWCPRPRRTPPPRSSVSFLSRLGRGWRPVGSSGQIGEARMCGPFVLQQQGWWWLFPSSCSSPSLHSPTPIFLLYHGDTDSRDCSGH